MLHSGPGGGGPGGGLYHLEEGEEEPQGIQELVDRTSPINRSIIIILVLKTIFVDRFTQHNPNPALYLYFNFHNLPKSMKYMNFKVSYCF